MEKERFEELKDKWSYNFTPVNSISMRTYEDISELLDAVEGLMRKVKWLKEDDKALRDVIDRERKELKPLKNEVKKLKEEKSQLKGINVLLQRAIEKKNALIDEYIERNTELSSQLKQIRNRRNEALEEVEKRRLQVWGLKKKLKEKKEPEEKYAVKSTLRPESCEGCRFQTLDYNECRKLMLNSTQSAQLSAVWCPAYEEKEKPKKSCDGCRFRILDGNLCISGIPTVPALKRCEQYEVEPVESCDGCRHRTLDETWGVVCCLEFSPSVCASAVKRCGEYETEPSILNSPCMFKVDKSTIKCPKCNKIVKTLFRYATPNYEKIHFVCADCLPDNLIDGDE